MNANRPTASYAPNNQFAHVDVINTIQILTHTYQLLGIMDHPHTRLRSGLDHEVILQAKILSLRNKVIDGGVHMYVDMILRPGVTLNAFEVAVAGLIGYLEDRVSDVKGVSAFEAIAQKLDSIGVDLEGITMDAPAQRDILLAFAKLS